MSTHGNQQAEPAEAANELVSSAVDASQQLAHALKSIASHDHDLRMLRRVVDSLTITLETLRREVNNAEPFIAIILAPVTRVTEHCSRFLSILTKKVKRQGDHVVVTDWNEIKYMTCGIPAFADVLSVYKESLSVAADCLSWRSLTLPWPKYQDLDNIIEDTVSDLNRQLSDVTTWIRGCRDPADRNRLEAEKEGLGKCKELCAKAKDYIMSMPIGRPRNALGQVASPAPGKFSPDVERNLAFNNCSGNIKETRLVLRKSLPVESMENLGIEERFDNMQESVDVCRDLAEQAMDFRSHHFEKVSHSGLGFQLILSTVKDQVGGKEIEAGHAATQMLGSLKGDDLQRLPQPKYEVADIERLRRGGDFIGKYGSGQKLDFGGSSGRGKHI